MSEFKLGQRVVVANPTLKSHNQKGWVQNFHGNFIEVELDNGNMLRTKPESLRLPLLETDRKTKFINTIATKHLAFLYLHDENENPKTLDEAWESGWCLAQHEDHFYGTIEGIKYWLNRIEDRGYEHWSHAFVIIDSVLYPIEFKKTVSVNF